jgi:predicted nucleic acid-binding Zn ribbon protein
MNKAGDLLGCVARKLNRPEAALAWLASAWPHIVGKTLAAHTRPVQCEKGCLVVEADAKWHKQLQHMTRDFCVRINEAWGRTLIREVKFMAAKRIAAIDRARSNGDASAARSGKPGPKRLPYELDNEHTPFIRRK